MCIRLLRRAGRRRQKRHWGKRRGNILLVLFIHVFRRHTAVLHVNEGLASFDRLGSILENAPGAVAGALDSIAGQAAQRRRSFWLPAARAFCAGRIGARAAGPEERLDPDIFEHLCLAIFKGLRFGLALGLLG